MRFLGFEKCQSIISINSVPSIGWEQCSTRSNSRCNSIRTMRTMMALALRRGESRRFIDCWLDFFVDFGLALDVLFSFYGSTNIPHAGLAIVFFKVPKRIYKFSGGRWRYKSVLVFVNQRRVLPLLWGLAVMFMSMDVADISINRNDKFVWFLGELLGGALGEGFYHEDYQRSLLSSLIDVGYDVRRLSELGASSGDSVELSE